MSLVDRMIAATQRGLPTEEAAAHCDIPCGIYDPHTAQIAAHTVIRMVDLIEGLGELNDTAKLHTFNRHVQTKEEHARIVEQEIIILWTDYFRPEHAEQHGNDSTDRRRDEHTGKGGNGCHSISAPGVHFQSHTTSAWEMDR